MNKPYKLWLDDQISEGVRPIPEGEEWVGAQSTDAAILTLLDHKCLPSFISFDYDLGGSDTAEEFIRYMIENHYDCDVPDYEVHSENVAGQKIIISLMDSWKKSQKL